MISRGVMKTHDLKDTTFYEVGCDCGSSDCNMTIELEYCPEFNIIFMNFYKKVSLSIYWNDSTFVKRIWRRIKYSIQILFKGYIELTETHVFQDIEHIDAFIEAMQEGKEKLKDAGIPQDSDGVSA
jgi:hypothetical protein